MLTVQSAPGCEIVGSVWARVSKKPVDPGPGAKSRIRAEH